MTTLSEAYANLMEMKSEQKSHIDAVLRKLEAVHNPPHVKVDFERVVELLEKKRAINQ